MTSKEFNEPLSRKLRSWMATVVPAHETLLNGSESYHEVMKTGVILCDLLNALEPGIVKGMKNSKLAFQQMENINIFLSSCKAVGILDSALFVTVDLFDQKNLSKTLDCIFEIQKKYAPEEYKKLRHEETVLIDVVVKSGENDSTTQDLQQQQLQQQLHLLQKQQQQQQQRQGEETRTEVTTMNDDIELKKKLKFTPQLASAIKNWIEAFLEEKITGNFIEALKNGVILCRLINKLQPGSVEKIYEGNIAYKQMENIVNYIAACRRCGFNPLDLFETADLFKENDIMKVLVHLNALAKWAESQPSYSGPQIEDTSHAENMIRASIIGAEIQINETEPEQWTQEEQVVIDWANSHLIKKDTNLKINNIQSLRSGIRFSELLKILTGVRDIGNIEQRPLTILHFVHNETIITRFLSTYAFESIPVMPGEIANGVRDAIYNLLNFIQNKFDYDIMFQMMVSQLPSQQQINISDYLPEEVDNETQVILEEVLHSARREKEEKSSKTCEVTISDGAAASNQTKAEAKPKKKKKRSQKKQLSKSIIPTHLKETPTTVTSTTPTTTPSATPKVQRSLKTPDKTPSEKEITTSAKKSERISTRVKVVSEEKKEKKPKKKMTPEEKEAKIKQNRKSCNATTAISHSYTQQAMPKIPTSPKRKSYHAVPELLSSSDSDPTAIPKSEKKAAKSSRLEKAQSTKLISPRSDTPKDSEKKRSRSKDLKTEEKEKTKDLESSNRESSVEISISVKGGAVPAPAAAGSNEGLSQEISEASKNKEGETSIKLSIQVPEDKKEDDSATEESDTESDHDKTSPPTGTTNPTENLPPPPPPPDSATLQAQAMMRQRVAQEILTTERSYIKSLEDIKRELITFVRAANWLKKDEFEAVFCNLEQILDEHKNFLLKIEPKIVNWTPKSTLGKEFYLHTDFLQNYKPYLINFNTANLSLEILMTKYLPLSLVLLGFELALSKTSGYKVADILIMPVQRIPRYIMLLGQLQKFTLSSTADYKFLEAAGKKIMSTLETINRDICLDRLAKMEEVVHIRNAFVECTEEMFPTDLKRELIKEGSVNITKIVPSSSSNPSAPAPVPTLPPPPVSAVSGSDKKKFTNKKIDVFLFNDYFVICSPTKEKKERKKIRTTQNSTRENDYEFLEAFHRSAIEEVSPIKKKEFCVKWKKEEWYFETKLEEEAKIWVNTLTVSH